MSSEYDFINSLLLGKKYLYRFGGSVLMGLGMVSSLLSLIVFTKKKLRKNPCAIYLAATNISSLIFICISLFIQILSSGYDITFTVNSLSWCRSSMYMTFAFDILRPFYLILASIDRVLITSSNARTRQRSTHRLAYTSIIIGTIFWMLFHIHALVLPTLIQIAPNYVVCYFHSTAELEFIFYYSILIKGFLLPLSLLIFGLWSIKNVRSIGRGRVVPVLSTTETTAGNDAHPVHSKDRQLILMLLIDICIYIIFCWFLASFLLYQQITKYNMKSLVQTQIEFFISSVTLFGDYIPYCVGCYTNLLVSKTFRSEVKNTLLCK